MGNCGGQCCAVFVFSSSLDDIKLSTEGKLKRGGKTVKIRDDEQLLDMLIPLTDLEAAERAEKFGVKWPEKSQADLADAQTQWDGSPPPAQLYTCRHWDEQTKLCTIYDERPSMCRDYPYGKTCVHGCGYTNSDEEDIVLRYIDGK